MAFVSQLFPTLLNCYEVSSGNQGILLVRPMLEFSKDDMYKICQGGHQEWLEDPTNQSQLFSRNRIRTSLTKITSCAFRSEIQSVISAYRFTRTYIESICHKMLKHSVTVMDHGYAIIDLEKLEPSNVEHICLSKFLTLILQFISQRHRPIRGSVSQLLLDYISNSPCKASFTAAGCYLCAAPQSKGTKILVCFSPGSPRSSKIWSSYKIEQSSLSKEIDWVIKDARSHSNRLVAEASRVPFLHAKSSESLLLEAKELNLISESTLSTVLLLQQEESRKFLEPDSDYESSHEKKIASDSSMPLLPGESCHFMSRFIVRWEWHGDVCQICKATVSVRHMVDADWLYLAKTLEDCEGPSYQQLSARGALHALKSVPASARRGLPVFVDSHGLLLSIPSIGFSSCPCMKAVAIFKPRVPLGGGYSSYI